jgi:hypothetical protein
MFSKQNSSLNNLHVLVVSAAGRRNSLYGEAFTAFFVSFAELRGESFYSE